MNKVVTIGMIIGVSFLLNGCITTDPSTGTVAILNERLTNLENELETKPPAVKKRSGVSRDELTDAQKDFIKFMMDYLGK